jgi:hypothetical protein
MTALRTVLTSVFVVFGIQTPSSAQWLTGARGVPRAADGKIALSAPAPKTADGKPDIRGTWQIPPPPQYLQNLAKDLKPGELEMTPWAQPIYNQRRATESKDDPHHSCIVSGVPRSWLPPYPAKIFNTPDEVVILFEAVQTWRQVFTDGRALPKDPNPTWMGYSIGQWDGDTFVIETTGFKDKGWLDVDGHPLSDQLRVTERLRRKDFGHLDVQVTIDDPKAYKQPWTVALPMVYQDSELLEFICAENNRDLQHIVGK